MKKMAANDFALVMLRRSVISLVILLALYDISYSQHVSVDSTSINKKRLRTLIIGSSAAYTVSMAGLYQLWYSNSEQQSFQFFNDNAEWKQVDKIGHFGSAFYMSYTAHKALRWTGMPLKRSDVIAPLTGFLILLPIEVFDGFSDAYGASTGDLLANAGGAALFYGQQTFWNEIRIYPKISFHTTSYAARRPDVLGDNFVSQLFKDYNGQTHWLSFDMDKFTRFPKWMNIAFGYGAEEMVYARDAQNREINLDPHRQFYISLDFDLTAVKTQSKAIRTLLFLANIVKLPAPALIMSGKGTTFKPFYF